ncbi:MAG TPA: LemA family protein [Bacilli bacterium]|nr:LemA family protein [Bacilli bacterium]
MPGWLIIIIIGGGLLLIIGGFIVVNYNALVSLRNKVKDQWAQIDVQLKRRFDLIPNLLETVKGYAKHESETFAAVVEARNSFTAAKTPEAEMKANSELTNVISKLFALAESYPDLKANTNFMQMQGDLKDTEDKISFARQFYNDGVLQYNNKVEMFPSNLIASIFRFEKATFFEVANTERENIKVQF